MPVGDNRTQPQGQTVPAQPGGELPLPNLVDVPLGAASVVSLDVPVGATFGEVVITSSVEIAVQRRTTRGHGLVGFGIVGALPVRQR